MIQSQIYVSKCACSDWVSFEECRSLDILKGGGDVIGEQFSLHINLVSRQTYSGTGIESKIVEEFVK